MHHIVTAEQHTLVVRTSHTLPEITFCLLNILSQLLLLDIIEFQAFGFNAFPETVRKLKYLMHEECEEVEEKKGYR